MGGGWRVQVVQIVQAGRFGLHHGYLSGQGGPKSVKSGRAVWVARWFLDGAGKQSCAWDKGPVVGGSQKVQPDEETTVTVPVRFETQRT